MLDVDRANMLDVALWSLTEFFAKSHRQSQICEAGLVGSGGAGKSKMINALLGEPAPFQDGERDPAVVGVHPRDAELGAACFLNARFRAYRPSVGRRQGRFRFVSELPKREFWHAEPAATPYGSTACMVGGPRRGH